MSLKVFSNPSAMVQRALVAGLLSAVLVSGTATATSRTVAIKSDGFLAKTLTVYLNDNVGWKNDTSATHKVSAKRFNWFNTTVPAGAYSPYFKFQHAGTWAYTCTDHPNLFTGAIRVRMNKQPSTGTTTTNFLITVATAAAPYGFIHDVQKRKSGQDWKAWTNTQGMVATFDPSTPGTYEFRGRMRRISNGNATGWSPTLTIQVT